MEYKIVVTKLDEWAGKTHYSHLFSATLMGLYSARSAYYEIKDKFPSPQYKISLEIWQHSGREVNASEYFNEA